MVYQKVHLILSFDSYHHSVLLFIGGSFVIILVSMLKVCLMFCGGNKKKIKKKIRCYCGLAKERIQVVSSYFKF